MVYDGLKWFRMLQIVWKGLGTIKMVQNCLRWFKMLQDSLKIKVRSKRLECFRVVFYSLGEWFLVVQDGLGQFRMVQDSLEWFRVIKVGLELFRMIQDGLEWFGMVYDGLERVRMIYNDFGWF